MVPPSLTTTSAWPVQVVGPMSAATASGSIAVRWPVVGSLSQPLGPPGNGAGQDHSPGRQYDEPSRITLVPVQKGWAPYTSAPGSVGGGVGIRCQAAAPGVQLAITREFVISALEPEMCQTS